ncbi:MAG: signal peptide peptidase SppA [Prevotellaceae bacterium]|jgi:protease-4|nr:signal peptide peptidase SppA [Prevotellaceae bacterium]
MKKFILTFFAALLAVMVGSVLSMFVFFGAIGAMLSFTNQSETVAVSSNTVLRIMLDRPVQERGGDMQLNMGLNSLSIGSNIGLNDLLKGVKQAAVDPKIQLIYMNLSDLYIGIGHAEELRNALLQFKESGKPIIAYADNFSQKAYYLASVADKIYLNPYGSLNLKGLGAELTFYKKLLEKLDVNMQIFRHGKYKSAIEPYTAEEMSSENREQILSFTGSIWQHWLNGIAAARQIDAAQIQQLADNYDLSLAASPTVALSHNLIDGLLYKDQLLQELVKLTGAEDEQSLTMVEVDKYAKTVSPKSIAKERVAVVYADGAIGAGKYESNITDWHFANVLRKLRYDEQVKAVVFRVNSPGGQVQASEIIARELTLLNDVKPVVVSMSNYAASGGYWISAPARTIVANPTTLTGSIGVFGVVPDYSKGMRNYLGLTHDVAKTAQAADFPTANRPMTTLESKKFQSMIDTIYTQFVTKVAHSRNMGVQAVDDIAQGRVWTGLQAVQNGLVDELGGLDRAIEIAAEYAELTDYRITELPEQKDPMTQLMSLIKGSGVQANNKLMQTYKQLEKQTEQWLHTQVLARMPYEVDFE